MKEKDIPKKNYLIVVIISVITIFLTFYISVWIKTIKESDTSVGVLDGIVQQININEVNIIFDETKDAILYVGNKKDKELDKMILKILKKCEFIDNFYYLSLNDSNEKLYIEKLKKEFPSLEIKECPMFIYFRDGEAIRVIDSKEREVSPNDLKKLIERYN